MIQQFKKLSELHSATCFLNALLREWHEYVIYQSAETCVLIRLTHTKSLQIPLLRFSLLGRHQYTGKFYLKSHDCLTEISFETLLECVCDKLAKTANLTTLQFNQFKTDVLSSNDNIYQSLKLSCDKPETNYDFKTAEQALMIGHNFHPTPKSRDKLTAADLQHYAPEFKGEFPLSWLLVDPMVTQQINAHHFNHTNWLIELFLQEYSQNEIHAPFIHLIHQGMLPVPMHPWQWRFLQENPVIMQYIQKGQIIPVDQSEVKWAATSSLRTVYRDDSPYMLKFSMNLKLTNSVRVLLSSEVARGLLLHDVLATDKGQQFLQEFPNFHIITEPAYLCLMDLQGHPMEATGMVCRYNSFDDHNKKNKFMLATLIQDDPFGGISLLLTLIKKSHSHLPIYERLKKWFADFLHVTIKPLIMAYTKYGIIMEGHQQNIVLALENGFPRAAYFRDCQDHAYSEYGHHLFADEVIGIKRNPSCVANKEIGCHYFIYQVILNSTFNVITTLAKSNSIHEIELLGDLRCFLQDMMSQDSHDPYCLDQLLNKTTLLHKCNFKFALSRINDNQVPSNPLSLYVEVPNLIRPNQQKMRGHYSQTILYHRYFEAIQKTITLRTMDLEIDLNQFFAWQHQPRVAKYWQLNQSQEEVKLYLKQLMTEPYHQPVMIEINHELVGYSELYWAAKDRLAKHYDYHDFDRGFHLLIGQEHWLGVHYTTTVFMAIMDYLYLESSQTMRIVVEPDKHNQRFIKYMNIIPGWRLVKEIDFPEKCAALFMSQRNDFILEGV